MKSESKFSIRRLIALCLACMMLIVIMPIPYGQAATAEHPNVVTVSVVDPEGNPVAGASVAYILTDADNRTITNTAVTDSNGVAEVPEADETYTISASVTCEKFKTGTLSTRAITSATDDFTVTLARESISGVTIISTKESYTGKDFPAVKLEGLLPTDAVTVTVDGNATVLNAERSNMPQICEVKDYTVKVEIEREGYAKLVKTVTSQITKGSFTLPLKAAEETYTGSDMDSLVWETTPDYLSELTVLSFKLDGVDNGDKIPQVREAKTYKVQVHAERPNYADFDEEYIVTVKCALIENADVQIRKNELTYTGEPQQLITIEGSDKDKYAYEIRVEGDEETYDNAEALKKTEAGEYTVLVTIKKDNYEPLVLTAEKVTIKKAEQSLSFTNEAYTDQGELNVELGTDVGTAENPLVFTAETDSPLGISYCLLYENKIILDDETIASIDRDGKLTLQAACSLIVVASLEGDENHEEVSICFYVNASAKDDLLEPMDDISYIMGADNGVAGMQKVSLVYPKDTGSVSYAFADEALAKESGLMIDKDTGRITVADYSDLNTALRASEGVLEAEVVVTKAAVTGETMKDGTLFTKYAAAEAAYTLTITYAEPSEEAVYGLYFDENGANPAEKNEEGWYNQNLYLIPAPGFTAATAIDRAADQFASPLLWKDNGETELQVYLRNAKGEIYAPIVHGEVKLDTVAPSDLSLEYLDPLPVDGFMTVLSLNFYQSEARVELSAKDTTSGVDYFIWRYIREDGVSQANAASTEWCEDPVPAEYNEETGRYTAVITLTEETFGQMRGHVEFYAVDVAGNSTEENYYSGEGYVLDTLSPELLDGEISFSEPVWSSNDKDYYNGDITGTITIRENNFFPGDIKVECLKNGAYVEFNVDWTEEDTDAGMLNKGVFTIEGPKEDQRGDGEYVIIVTYTDRSGNEMTAYTSRIKVIDTTDPAMTVTYNEPVQTANDKNYYAGSITGTITMTERNFFEANAKVTYTCSNGNTGSLNVEWSSQSQSGDYEGKFVIPADLEEHLADGEYKVTVTYADSTTGTDAADVSATMVLDTLSPEELQFVYLDPAKTREFADDDVVYAYNTDAEILLSAEDSLAGVEYFMWRYVRRDGVSSENGKATEWERLDATWDETKAAFTGVVTLRSKEVGQLYGRIEFYAVDFADNGNDPRTACEDEARSFVLDSIAPKLDVEYEQLVSINDNIHYYNNDIRVTLNVREADFLSDDMTITVTKDKEPFDVTVEWKSDDARSSWTGTFIIPAVQEEQPGDGVYSVTASYEDLSGNKLQVKVTTSEEDEEYQEMDYVSPALVLDTTSPLLNGVSFNKPVQQANDKDYYNGSIVGTIEIVETNFYEDQVKVSYTKDGAEEKTELKTDWSGNNGAYVGTFTIPADQQSHEADGEYCFYVEMSDSAGMSMQGFASNIKVIDTKAPDDIDIQYLLPVSTESNKQEHYYYYQEKAKIQLFASDETAGVEYFRWRYVCREDVSSLNQPSTAWAITTAAWDTTEKCYTATIDLSVEDDAYMNGYIEFMAVDFASNGLDHTVSEENGFFVLDSTRLTFGPVTYNEPTGLKTEKKDYYNEDVEVTVTVNEINFSEDLMHVFYQKDGSEEVEIGDVDWVLDKTDEDKQIHFGTFTLPAAEDHSDDGDYIIIIRGEDLSHNAMNKYVEERIKVIDTTAPIIDTRAYNPEDSSNQTLTIQITEHNFHPQDLMLDVEAKNIKGEPVDSNYDAILNVLNDPENWQTEESDVYELTLDKEFADAWYELTLNYSDLANNAANEHKTERFAIDHTKPDANTFRIEYSEPIYPTEPTDAPSEQPEAAPTEPTEVQPTEPTEDVSTYFYNNGEDPSKPLVEITVYGNDETSGISSYRFVYTREEGASAVNLENFLLENGDLDPRYEIAAAAVVDENEETSDASEFVASIRLPMEDVEQLRGHIGVIATDARNNVSDVKTDTGNVIVVDSIAPTWVEAYSAPSGTDGENEYYYNNDAVVTLTITEANFYEKDVKVNIARESGGNFQYNVAWSGENDEHVATITIPAPANGGNDGHYTIRATYTDRSNNEMEDFESKRITIDTTAPVITVRYDNNTLTSANYIGGGGNAKYFKATRQATVTIVEHNFDFDNNAGANVTISAARGASVPAVNWVHNGDTHTATIFYATDGDYTFDVSAVDLARNQSGDVDYAGSAAPKEFTIDTRAEMITIDPESIEDGKAYIYDDTVIPAFKIFDENLQGYEATLTGVQRSATVDLTKEVEELLERNGNTVTGLLDVFEKKAELDGIYTLRIRSADYADNPDEQSVRFTVNRFGSVYEYSDTLLDLIADGGSYNRDISQDLTFTIYNASPISNDNVIVLVTRDGTPMDAAFAVEEIPANGESWYTYLVTVSGSNFAQDGIYTVAVSTTDDAGGDPVENSDANSGGDIRFVVDSTAPQLQTVIGLEEDIVNSTELAVSFDVFDTGGLAAVQVLVDGVEVLNVTEFEDASSYSGSFTIAEKSSAQHVTFILTDKAGNVTNSDDAGFEVPYVLEKDVTVSTNVFVRWFANKPLFFGSIGAVVLLGGAAGAAIALKKKKKAKVA